MYLRGFASAAFVVGGLHALLFFWRWASYRGPHRPEIILESGLASLLYLALGRGTRNMEGNPRVITRVAWGILILSILHASAVILLHDNALKTVNLLLIALACPLLFPLTLHYVLATLVCLSTWFITLTLVKPFHFEIWGNAWITTIALGLGIHLFVRRLLGDLERVQARDRRLLRDKTRLLVELREAMDNVKALQGLIPMCAHCKKVRNDGGYWEKVEVFINSQTGRQLTHGYCPECYIEALKELEELKAQPNSST